MTAVTVDGPIVNIAAYKFVDLDDLQSLRDELRDRCLALDLKGTILLSREGINLFLAGARQGIDSFLSDLRGRCGFEDLETKESLSDEQPFTRMLVRLKKEIIAFGIDGIEPRGDAAPKLKATELKAWLDEGKPVTMFDVRNDYEVKLGTFDNAVPAGIDHFRQFPEAVARLPANLKKQPLVMFCTGGIRCEKAGPYMVNEGFEQVYQLDGGILKYFEEVGGEHYDGECFVFDKRVALDPALNETPTTQCYICQAPLTEEEQSQPEYVFGESCPHCYRSPDTWEETRLVERMEAWRSATEQLPGSLPYESRRPMYAGEADVGKTVLAFAQGMHKHIAPEVWAQALAEGRLLLNDAPATETSEVKPSDCVTHVRPNTVDPDVNTEIDIVSEDEAVLVINKPAPLPVHACGRFQRNTFGYCAEKAWPDLVLRPAHRLDANTTGLLVMTKKRRFARLVQQQFDRREVKKAYLARVHGHPEQDKFLCDTNIGRNPGDAGTRKIDANGDPAETQVEVLERFADGTSLLLCTPKTGRTNQIRLHLQEAGHAIVGDNAYGENRDTVGGMSQTETLCLHAWKITFLHPITRVATTYQTSKPAWAA